MSSLPFCPCAGATRWAAAGAGAFCAALCPPRGEHFHVVRENLRDVALHAVLVVVGAAADFPSMKSLSPLWTYFSTVSASPSTAPRCAIPCVPALPYRFAAGNPAPRWPAPAKPRPRRYPNIGRRAPFPRSQSTLLYLKTCFFTLKYRPKLINKTSSTKSAGKIPTKPPFFASNRSGKGEGRPGVKMHGCHHAARHALRPTKRMNVMRSPGLYFPQSTRVLSAEYADGLRTPAQARAAVRPPETRALPPSPAHDNPKRSSNMATSLGKAKPESSPAFAQCTSRPKSAGLSGISSL